MVLITRSPYNAYVTRTKPGTLTPQSQPIKGQEDIQVKNAAGGYVYKLDDWKKIERFAILGTEGGSYYATEQALTLENAKHVRKMIDVDGPRVVSTVVDISTNNRAPKADPGLFILALCAAFGDNATKKAVHEALPKVARIPTHLMTFVDFVTKHRGWGRALREMVANWYTQAGKPNSQVAYHATKYQSRDGWSNRDLLRLSHAKTTDVTRNEIFHWMVKGWDGIGEAPHPDEALRKIWAFEKAKRASDVKEIVALIRQYGLPRECVPTQWLKDRGVWEALLVGGEDGRGMPTQAMIRNLASMSRVGLLTPMSEPAKLVCERLQNEEALKRARIHPIQVLSALRVYSSGGQARGLRSHGDSFEPLPQINSALNEAFYASFGGLSPSGKRTLLALDVSSSMGGGEIAGIPGLTPCEAEAAMAMATARAEWSNGAVSYPMYHSVAFQTNVTPFALSPTDTIEAVTARIQRMNFGGTDTSAAIKYALDKNILVDTFIVYTDNETWAGHGHTSEWLEKYRKATNLPSRLIVVAFTSTGHSIARTTDPLSLDVTGFDSAAPQIMAEFSKGLI